MQPPSIQSGSAWEWCRSYPTRCFNCANLTDYSIRVIRGGSFCSDRESLYTTSRLYHAPNQADFALVCAARERREKLA